MISSFLSTKALMMASEKGLVHHRAKLWKRLQPTLDRTPALKAFSGLPLEALPICDPATLRANYGAWNSLGLTHDEMFQAAQDGEGGGRGDVRPGINCGFSTGTSGQKGIFVTTALERSNYLGQTLARMLPLATLLGGARIGLILRASSALYSDIGSSRRFSFKHFPLTLSDNDLVTALQSWQPTILIAPAHRLATIAQSVKQGSLVLRDLHHCFTGSEPMGEAERAWIEAHLGVRPDPIYQATEGFIAAPCRYGHLHLNEHALVIDQERVKNTNYWRPIVTDLHRKSQPIIKVRLDDLLEDDEVQNCACGYAGRRIAPIFGRVQDIWHWDEKVVTPRHVIQAFEANLPPGSCWQAIGEPAKIEVRLPLECPLEQQQSLVAAVTAHLQIPVPIHLSPLQPSPPNPKRRQVQWLGPAYV